MRLVQDRSNQSKKERGDSDFLCAQEAQQEMPKPGLYEDGGMSPAENFRRKELLFPALRNQEITLACSVPAISLNIFSAKATPT